MKTVIIIQARMGSTRLPGKVMKKIVGIPTIGIILKRLKKTKEAEEVVEASTREAREVERKEILATVLEGQAKTAADDSDKIINKEVLENSDTVIETTFEELGVDKQDDNFLEPKEVR